MDKMREAFEKWAKSECLDTDSVDGFYSDNDTHIAWGSWQAAQSAAVPVVGDVVIYQFRFLKWPVGYWENCSEQEYNDLRSGYDGRLLIIQPTTSITADELDALRKDAERYRWLRMKGAHCDAVDKVHMLGPQLDQAIDAAIAGETNHG